MRLGPFLHVYYPGGTVTSSARELRGFDSQSFQSALCKERDNWPARPSAKAPWHKHDRYQLATMIVASCLNAPAPALWERAVVKAHVQ